MTIPSIPPLKDTAMAIENTTASMSDPASQLLFLAASLGPGGVDQAIAEQERAGQQQLVHSDRLPVDTGGTDEAFLALGFTFGPADAADPMFRPAALPAGWERQASDHDMWSHLVDGLGRKRVAVFYKAAAYDRSAHMRVVSVYEYVAECVHDGTPVVADAVWATPGAVVAAARSQIARAEEYAAKYVKRGDSEEAAEYEARRDRFAAVAAEFDGPPGGAA